MKRLLLAVGLVMAAGWMVGAGAQEKAVGAGKEGIRPSASSTATGGPLSKTELNRRSRASQQGSVLLVADKEAVTEFSDRLEFHEVPAGMKFDPATGQLNDSRGVRTPIELIPNKIIWLESPFNVKAAGKKILLCMIASEAPFSKKGMGDFCGVISSDGTILYRFPVKQHWPETLLKIIGISKDGAYAEVYVGRAIGGEDGPGAGEPREILAWREPNKLKRIPGPWHKGAPKDKFSAYENLRLGFKTRKESP